MNPVLAVVIGQEAVSGQIVVLRLVYPEAFLTHGAEIGDRHASQPGELERHVTGRLGHAGRTVKIIHPCSERRPMLGHVPSPVLEQVQARQRMALARLEIKRENRLAERLVGRIIESLLLLAGKVL